MNIASDYSLSRTALTGDKDIGIHLGNPPRFFDNLLHNIAFRHKVTNGEFLSPLSDDIISHLCQKIPGNFEFLF